MEAFKCDRCGKYFDYSGSHSGSLTMAMGKEKIQVALAMQIYDGYITKAIEVCDNCFAEIALQFAKELTTK